MTHLRIASLLVLGLLLAGGCANQPQNEAAKQLKRSGNEIMVAGQLFDIGTPVVLWTDPGGFDAYRTERRFAPFNEASFEATTRAATTQPASIQIKNPNRLDYRWKVLTPEELEVARGGMPLKMVQDKVDQFVIHYDVAGTSANCFKVLHDSRGLSVQFMLDIDGTIYQSCDLREACWQATKANHRGIGIEIANMGSYSSGEPPLFKRWYDKDEKGKPYIKVPDSLKKYIRTKDFVGHPARDEMIEGEVQGRRQRQYDYTPEQYAALTKLVAGVCTVLPKINCDYPRDENGKLINHALSDAQWNDYHGVLGHYHVQTNKSDPGPAFNWDKVIDNARRRMGLKPKPKAGTVSTSTAPTSQPTPGVEPTSKPSRVAGSPRRPSFRGQGLREPSVADLQRRLDEILHRKDAGEVHYVARVIDLASGRELYAHDIDTPVMPASNGKIAVSAATLDRFGSSHTFKTYLAMDGDDLWLIGTGDPACGDSKLAKSHGGTTTTMLDEWANALKARGVELVKGKLYYYAGAFDDESIHPSWSRSFLTDWYAAPVTGLNFNDNCVDIKVTPTSPGQPATFSVVPPTDNVVKVTSGIVTREGDGPEPTIERAKEGNVYTLSGACSKPTDLESKPVVDPAAFFADALRTHLTSRGITIDGQTQRADKAVRGSATPPADTIIATHETKMPDALWRINKSSQNLFAEAFCKYLGRQYRLDAGVDEPGAWKAGCEAVHAFLRKNKIDESPLVVADGSGLSRQNRVTARLISDLFVTMYRHPEGETFRNSLGVAGKDGTIGKRMNDIAGRVFAKTGYIGGVRALSGYVHCKNDKWLVFSIIYNGLPSKVGSSEDVKPYEALQDEAVHVLYNWPDLSVAATK
jgi:PBP4 family serine-type D-alanyl-D-alanine carboxypeptidase